jgi:hypothetical protein
MKSTQCLTYNALSAIIFIVIIKYTGKFKSLKYLPWI